MFLEGKRIYLREITQEDVADNYYDWMSDPEVTKYLESRYWPQSKERIAEYIASMKPPENIFLAIISKEIPGRHIGNIRLSINLFHRFAEIGLIIGIKSLWGKGYGTEAISLVRDYAFGKLSLLKLTAGSYVTNTASIKAFKKAGFVEEGLLRKQYHTEYGKRTDEVVLGCLAEEYWTWPTSSATTTDYSFKLSPEAAASLASQRE